MQEDSTKGRDCAQGGQYKRGEDSAGGHYIGEVWCMRKLQKGGMVQEYIINGRDDAGGQYNRV